MSKLKWEKPVLHPLNTDAANLAFAACANGGTPSGACGTGIALTPIECGRGNGANQGGRCEVGNGVMFP